MLGYMHPKIIGAILIGIAFVGGAYTYANFGKSNFPAPVNTVASAAAPRVAITVTDSDNNGIEDWRDQFITTEPIIIEATASSTYTLPETVTGRVGIQLFEDIIRARNGGPFSPSQDEVIANTVNSLADEAQIELYDTSDIVIMDTWTDEDIRNYGNAMAGAILRNNIEGIDYEVDILNDALNRNKPERMEDLKIIAGIYERTRDDSLVIPVPKIFLKQHLDLINTYHAIQENIFAFTLSAEDPAIALLHIKRYEEDSLGLFYALENMSLTLANYPGLFSEEDPANFFTLFNPNRQTN